jgi:hypothetical protein
VSNPAPSQIEIAIYRPSYDGQFWGRYPNGDKPGPSMFANASAAVAGVANLSTQIRMQIAAAIAVAAAATLSGGSASVMKFQTGWFGASGGNVDPNNTLSKFQPEMDDMMGTLVDGAPPDWIIGYRLFVHWAAIDEGPLTFSSLGTTSGTLVSAPRHGNQVYTCRFSNGQYRDVTVSETSATWSSSISGVTTTVHAYMFGLMDQIISRCATAYNLPKWFIPALVPMSFAGGTRKSGDFGILPQYIAQDSSMGSSPDGSSFGWWGAFPPPAYNSGSSYNSGDQVVSGSTTYQAKTTVPAGNAPPDTTFWQTALSRAYSAKIYNHNVAVQYGLLGKAFGDRYNSHPQFYGVIDQESAAVVGPALARNSFGQNNVNDGSYSDSAYTNELLSTVYPTWRAALPNCGIIVENSFLAGAAATQSLQLQLIQGSLQVGIGSADSLGHKYHVANPGALGRNWALETYAGQTAGGIAPAGPDYRVTAPNPRCFLDAEGPDIASTINPNNIGTTIRDLGNAANSDYKAPNLFVCHGPAGRATTPPAWSAATTYAIGDQANVSGTWYEALHANTNSAPTSSNANWKTITATPPTWQQITRIMRDNPLTTGKPGNYT